MLPAPIKDTNSSSSFVLPDQTCQRFTIAEIRSATNNFDKTLLIGRGGFGKVYKCLTIGSTREVAVKRLRSNSDQGAHEFEAEVKILSKLRHGNLVSLIGYCQEGKKMALVYEFMPNGTLEDHLHKSDHSSLSWLQRLKICIGAARGLDYLHTGTSTQHGVIHRDVKSSNILLDANFDAKISDFGLAKVGAIDQTRTHVSTAAKGTFGYMDPCYFYTGKLTRKSDVYAFGVVLFEVLSGKKAVDSTLDEEQWGLAPWAQDQIKRGKLNQIVDPRLMGQISKKCLKEFARIAGRCLHILPKQRPAMAEVVFKLESIFSQEKESANSVIDEKGFVYNLRSFFTAKVDASIGSKVDLTEVDVVTESKYDSSSHHKPPIVIAADVAIESINTNQSYRTFTYGQLKSATNGFKNKERSPTVDGYIYKVWDDKKTSPTVDGYIYKGWVDKKTYAPTKYGVGLEIALTKIEYRTEKSDIKLEGFNHPNLVKLLGYCLRKQELFCVYEAVSGLTLDKYLYGGRGTSLSWVARLKIATGAAEGLFYFHKRNRVAYSQFKTNRILVDMDYNARLLDFAFRPHTFQFDRYSYYIAPEWFSYQADIIDGLRADEPPKDGIFSKSEIFCIFEMISNPMARAFGWMEWNDQRNEINKETNYFIPLILSYQTRVSMADQSNTTLTNFTVKCEIYAFGVVLLEILTGLKVCDERRPFEKQNLVEWATPLLADKGNLGMIVDPQLQHNGCPPKGAFKLAQLVSNCLEPDADERPSMENILQVLHNCYQEEFKQFDS